MRLVRARGGLEQRLGRLRGQPRIEVAGEIKQFRIIPVGTAKGAREVYSFVGLAKRQVTSDGVDTQGVLQAWIGNPGKVLFEIRKRGAAFPVFGQARPRK